MIVIQNRKSWVDWLKTLGIFLIIWGHFFPPSISKYIYAINVPIFLFVSGYLSKITDKASFLKSILHLFLCYVLLNVLRLCLHIGMHGWPGYHYLIRSTIGILCGIHTFHEAEGCGELWYVFVLIIAKIIYQIVGDRFRIQAIISVIMLIVSCVYSQYYYNEHAPFALGPLPLVLLAYPVFIVGSLYRKYELLIDLKWWMVAVFIVGYIMSARVNGYVWMYIGLHGKSIFLFGLSTIFGIGILLKICKSIIYLPSFVSVHSIGTLFTLTFHMTCIQKINQHHLYIVSNPIVNTLIWSVIIMLVFYILILFFERFCPILLGKNNWKSADTPFRYRSNATQ